MNYQQIVTFIVNRRKEELAKARIAYLDLLKEDKTLFQLDSAYRACCLDFARNNDECKNKRNAIIQYLKAQGLFSKVYPPIRCKDCRDTGRVGKYYCDCVKRLSIKDEIIQIPLHSFEQSTPSIFGENAQLVQSTQNALMGICEKFPLNKLKNIVLMGKTGTGKTFLASCFADAMIKKEQSVVFISAFSMNNRLLKHHTSFDSERLAHIEPLIDCNVLIIDDLGSESIYKNVTIELFYHVINERYNAGKTTLITTNLCMDELEARYGQRICSRLFDKRICLAREFDFEDNRKIKL